LVGFSVEQVDWAAMPVHRRVIATIKALGSVYNGVATVRSQL
jgi:hypothetical protein